MRLSTHAAAVVLLRLVICNGNDLGPVASARDSRQDAKRRRAIRREEVPPFTLQIDSRHSSKMHFDVADRSTHSHVVHRGDSSSTSKGASVDDIHFSVVATPAETSAQHFSPSSLVEMQEDTEQAPTIAALANGSPVAMVAAPVGATQMLPPVDSAPQTETVARVASNADFTQSAGTAQVVTQTTDNATVDQPVASTFDAAPTTQPQAPLRIEQETNSAVTPLAQSVPVVPISQAPLAQALIPAAADISAQAAAAPPAAPPAVAMSVGSEATPPNTSAMVAVSPASVPLAAPTVATLGSGSAATADARTIAADESHETAKTSAGEQPSAAAVAATGAKVGAATSLPSTFAAQQGTAVPVSAPASSPAPVSAPVTTQALTATVAAPAQAAAQEPGSTPAFAPAPAAQETPAIASGSSPAAPVPQLAPALALQASSPAVAVTSQDPATPVPKAAVAATSQDPATPVPKFAVAATSQDPATPVPKAAVVATSQDPATPVPKAAVIATSQDPATSVPKVDALLGSDATHQGAPVATTLKAAETKKFGAKSDVMVIAGSGGFGGSFPGTVDSGLAAGGLAGPVDSQSRQPVLPERPHPLGRAVLLIVLLACLMVMYLHVVDNSKLLNGASVGERTKLFLGRSLDSSDETDVQEQAAAQRNEDEDSAEAQSGHAWRRAVYRKSLFMAAQNLAKRGGIDSSEERNDQASRPSTPAPQRSDGRS